MRLFFPPVNLPVPNRPGLCQFAEARIAESWAEVDELIPWLLKDAEALELNKESPPLDDEDGGSAAGDASDGLGVAAAALDTLTLDETPRPAEAPAADEELDAHQWPNGDDASDNAARASAWAQTCASLGLDPTTPPTAHTSTTPIYLLGLDTETDTARKDAPVLPDGIPRTAPSTLQLATRSRVLIVPIFHLYFHDAPTVSPALRHLLTERNDVVFAGVGIAEDAAPMAHWDLVPRHVVDVATVVRPWNVASGIEDLVFRFTTMLDDDAPDTDTDTDDEADLTPPPPAVPSDGACPFCPPAHTSSRPPPHLFTESHARHLVCPTTGTYPYLRVGWKSKSLIFSPWDAAPCTWPIAAMQYAALDALASHHVGVSLWPHAPPSALPSILPVPVLAPPVRINRRYRPPFRRIPGGGAAPAAVHRALLHVAGHRAVAVRDASKKIAAAKLLRVTDRNAVVTASLAHLVNTGHVQVRNEPGPRGGRGVARIVHVCPWAPDAPPVRMEGEMEVPPDLVAVLADGLPRIPGHVPTRDEMVRYVADHYPKLVVYATRDARRVADAWVAALGEEGVEDVQRCVVEQTGADAEEHGRRMRKAKVKKERKELEARGETPTSSASPSPVLDEPSPAAPRTIVSAAEFLKQNPDDDLSDDDLPRVPVPQQQVPTAATPSPSPSRSTPPTPTAPASPAPSSSPSRRSPRRTFTPDVLDAAKQFLAEFAYLSSRSHADPNLLVNPTFWSEPSLSISMNTTIRRSPLVRVLAAVFPLSRSVGAAHALLDALGGDKIVLVAWACPSLCPRHTRLSGTRACSCGTWTGSRQSRCGRAKCLALRRRSGARWKGTRRRLRARGRSMRRSRYWKCGGRS
ncbi:hypothetical protein AMAG_15139 [Allomyces macrogynus ATCC 38327]|uniref:Uncharacterized protein n=1 Tax=Allomyces macrogynus (strain ATCC 38327) TaxID=578462 RepID=A0A0L0T5U8_ALLM3|nr:hypothetical protein AMAG_15139 [Allomyces macrogynus ATCC 38327]|eukprot:KNE70168.1 hypothetical protein AMAG_15139 [Allomyces macrogynus ATCC 38327]